MPPEPVVFFVDRSLGNREVAAALLDRGARVEIHDAHFASDAQDAEWIEAVGRLGWVILTKDKRIRHRPLELAAVRAVGARMFALTAGNLTGQEMAEIFARHVESMTRIALSEPAPFVARVSRSRIVIVHLGR